MVWGFICILHIQPCGVLQGGIFILIQLFAAVFLLLGLPDVLSSCVQPQLWFHGAHLEHGREGRWQMPQGPSGGVPSKLVPGEIPSGDPAAPGIPQEWLERDPSVGGPFLAWAPAKHPWIY